MLKGYGEFGEPALLTQADLQKAIRTMLGDQQQVTVVRWDLHACLARHQRHHYGISWAEWQAAAAAEGLQIEKETGGWTIYRAGAQKLPVAEAPVHPEYSAIFFREPGTPAGRAAMEKERADDAKRAEQSQETGIPGGVPGTVREPPDAEKIAAEASAFVKQEALAGRTVSATVAVAAVMARHGWQGF